MIEGVRFLRDRIERFRAPAREHDRPAVSEKRERRRTADATSCSGDDDNALRLVGCIRHFDVLLL